MLKTNSNQKEVLKIAVRKFAPFEAAIYKIWEKYCKVSGCALDLEMVVMDVHPLYDALLGQQGLKKGDWDIALINTDWIAEAFETNSLENLASCIRKSPPEDFPSGWSESLLGMQNFNDAILGLPFHDGPECLIFRKDLFENESEKKAFYEKYNKELRPPATWKEYIDIAAFFHRPEQHLYGTALAGFPDGHNTVFDFCLQLWCQGGELTDEKGNVNIDSIESCEALEFYRELSQNASIMHPHSASFDSVKTGMAFARGEIALMVNWFGFASYCEVAADSVVKGKVDISAVPKAGKNGRQVSLNAYWMYGVASGSQHKLIAYDFISFAVNAENDKLLTLEGGIGCRKSTWSDPEINAVIPYYHKLSSLHDNARELPRLSNWFDISRIIDEVVLEVTNTVQPVGEIIKNGQEKIAQLSCTH